MKIAVVGGTFDPFHNGHLAVCEAVSALADVDRVLVVPARQSPLKEGETGAPGPARLAMAAAAVAHLPKCEVSDLELSRPGPSFTIDTLEELSRRHPGDQVALVIGADQWPIFHTWKDYDKIGAKYELLATTRAGYDLPAELAAGYPRARCVPVRPVAVTATELRRRLAHDLAVEEWVPAAVLAIIRREGLYRQTGSR